MSGFRRLMLAFANFIQLLGIVASTLAAENGHIGPSFDCSKAQQPLAQMICADADLSRLDLRFAQAYWALFQQVGEVGRPQLKQENIKFIEAVQQQCRVPKTGPVTPQTWGSPECVKQAYEKQRQLWLSRLASPAREEANRDPEKHLELQRALQKLGFLPASARIDGVYGTGTRTAIAAWQNSVGRAGTGILANEDARALEKAGAPTVASSTQVQGASERKPTAAGSQASFIEWFAEKDGQEKTYIVENTQLTLRARKAAKSDRTELEVVSAGGATTSVLSNEQNLGASAELRVRRLDPEHSEADVIFSISTGGAHCCTEVKVISLIGGSWKVVDVGGGNHAGPEPVDVNGKKVFVFEDERFLYAFTYYAASMAPLEILQIKSGAVVNVTEHSDFQALHRKTMDEHKKFCAEQNNGACAAYVASASRLGMFDAAWDFMLSNFDAKAAREWGLTYCQVGDARQSDCPQKITFTSYPEALDWFLRHHGYRDRNAPPPRLPTQTSAQAAAAEIPVIFTPEYMAESYSLCNPLAKCPPPRQILARLNFQIPSTNVRGEIRCEANETAVGIDIVNDEASQRLFLNDSRLLRVLDALKVNAMDECKSALRAGRLRTQTKQVPTQFAARSANDFRATSRGLAEPWIVQQNAAKDRKLEQERIAAETRAFNEKAAAVRADFASKVGRPIQTVPIAELLANPFPYVDTVVSYTAHFGQMISAHEGRFNVGLVNVVIRDIPTGLLRRPSAVVIAGKVVGNVPGANALEPVRVPLLSYSNIYSCSQDNCEDYYGKK